MRRKLIVGDVYRWLRDDSLWRVCEREPTGHVIIECIDAGKSLNDKKGDRITMRTESNLWRREKRGKVA